MLTRSSFLSLSLLTSVYYFDLDAEPPLQGEPVGDIVMASPSPSSASPVADAPLATDSTPSGFTRASTSTPGAPAPTPGQPPIETTYGA